MTGETTRPPVVVTLSEVIDFTNAEDAAATLLGARDDPGVIIADMTGTTFCDSMGMRMLILAAERAAASGSSLRVVVTPGGSVARKMAILSMERVMPVYPSIQDATAATSKPRPLAGSAGPTAAIESRVAS